MARWRGAYDSEDGADEFIRAAGGLESLWMLGMIDAGLWASPDIPAIGDVGVVAVCSDRYDHDYVGAIYGGKRWHMLSPNGIFAASIERENVAMIWRVN